MKVLLLCLKAFETMEFSVFVDVLGWARDEKNCDIHVITCGFQKTVTSTFGIPVMMDTTIDNICVAALALANSGILSGKKATTYHLLNGMRQKELAEYEGVTVVNEPVVIDGNIITSYCPETAVRVAFSLLEMLTNKQLRREIEELMGY